MQAPTAVPNAVRSLSSPALTLRDASGSAAAHNRIRLVHPLVVARYREKPTPKESRAAASLCSVLHRFALLASGGQDDHTSSTKACAISFSCICLPVVTTSAENLSIEGTARLIRSLPSEPCE